MPAPENGSAYELSRRLPALCTNGFLPCCLLAGLWRCVCAAVHAAGGAGGWRHAHAATKQRAQPAGVRLQRNRRGRHYWQQRSITAWSGREQGPHHNAVTGAVLCTLPCRTSTPDGGPSGSASLERGLQAASALHVHQMVHIEPTVGPRQRCGVCCGQNIACMHSRQGLGVAVAERSALGGAAAKYVTVAQMLQQQVQLQCAKQAMKQACNMVLSVRHACASADVLQHVGM